MMRCNLTVALLFSGCLFAQVPSWTDVDKALAEENSFKARFYLQSTIELRSTEARFALRNRILESFLLDRNQKDSVGILIADNRAAMPGIKDSRNKEHFAWLEAWSLQINNHPDKAYAMLTATAPKYWPNEAARLYRMAELERSAYRKFSDAQIHLQKAIRLYHQDSAFYHYKIYRCRTLLGLVSRDQNDNESAEKNYRLALNILDHIPEPKYDERARILNNLGNIHRTQYGKAKALYEESLELRQKYVKDSTALANAYANLGIFYFNFGNLTIARDLFDKALQYNTTPGGPYNILVYNYGLLLNEFYEFDAARSLIEQALAKSSGVLPAHHVSIIRLRLLLAQELCYNQNFSGAGQQLTDVRNALRKYPDTDPLWVNYYDVVSVKAFHQKNYPMMKAYADTAYQTFQRLKLTDPVLKSNLEKRIADASVQTGDLPGARQSYKLHRETLLQYQSPHSPSVILAGISIGETQMKGNDPDSAILYFRNALQSIHAGSQDSSSYLTERIMANTMLAEVMFAKFTTHGRPEDLRLAAYHIGESVGLVTRHKQLIDQEIDKLGFGRVFFEVFPLAVDIAYQRYHSEPTVAVAEELFRYLELSRIQILLNSMREMKIQQFAGVTSTVVSFETSLRDKENDLHQTLESLLDRQNPEPEILEAVKKEILQLDNKKKNFIDSIRQHIPDYFNLKYNETTVTLSQLQSLLGAQPEKAVLVYGAGQTELYGMLITAQGIKLESCAPWSAIRNNARLFRNQLRLQLDKSVFPTAGQLYNQLLSKFLDEGDHLKKVSTLVVVPDETLIHVPFEALMRKQNGRDARFMIESYDFVYSYSATLYWQKSTDKPWQQKDQGFLGFAPSFVSATHPAESERSRDAGSLLYDNFQFNELPGARHEVETIQSAFQRKKLNAQTYIGSGATESVFKTSSLKGYPYVHLATHGFANTNEDDLIGVAFYAGDNKKEDGLLLDREVYGLNLNARLVVLSACETGLGDQVKGEGVMGLSRAFMYAGVRSIMASLWKVEDNATMELMTNFYEQGILKNKIPSSALRNAKQSMIRKGLHPYYWASFVLIGAP